MASEPVLRLLTADEFLRIDFGPDIKAELDRGVIRMMAGGTAAHGRVQVNLILALGARLRGSGCRPFGSDMAVRISEGSIRYPDVTVFCNRTDQRDDRAKAFDDPRVICEVLSDGTAMHDQTIKLEEYKELASVDTILFVDPEKERVRVFQRTGPEAWAENWLAPNADLPLPSLGITLPSAEIFARD